MKMLLRMILLIFVLLIALVTFLLTPSGLRTTLKIATHIVPGKLHIQKVSGVMLGPFTLEGVHYQDQTQEIQLKKLRFDWSPLALIQHTLKITSLTLDGLTVITTTKKATGMHSLRTLKNDIETMIRNIKSDKPIPKIMINQAMLTNLVFENKANPKSETMINTILIHSAYDATKIDLQFQVKMTKPTPATLDFTVNGTPDNYHVLTHIQSPLIHFLAQGNGNKQGLDLTTTKNQFLSGTLSANLHIHFNPATTWNGEIAAQHLDPSLFNVGWINQLSIHIASKGNLTGSLNTKNDIHILTDKGNLDIHANYSQQLAINWNFKTTDLARWIDVHSGTLTTTGNIEGDITNPTLQANLLARFKSENVRLDTIKMTLNGDLAKHTLDIESTSTRHQITIHLLGEYRNNAWIGSLTQFTMSLSHQTYWHLAKTVLIKVLNDKISMSPLELISPKAGHILLQGETLKNKLDWSFDMTLAHFDWLKTFIPDLHVNPGAGQIKLSVTGTTEKPNFNGKININAQVFIQQLNIPIDQIQGNIHSENKNVVLNVTILSNKTPIVLKATINPFSLNANISLMTKNLLFVNTDEYVAYMDSNLTALIENQKVTLSGSITIPKANIQPQSFKKTVSLPDRDIVFVNTGGPIRKSHWILQNNISITLGNNVNIKILGVNAMLGGTLHILQDTNNQVILANGEIFVRKGTYSIFGQTLVITPDSYLGYNNNLIENPNLSIRATKTFRTLQNSSFSSLDRGEMTVGIVLDGSVKAPKISFFSTNSSLSQADILSYLLFGSADNGAPGNIDILLHALEAANITDQGLMGKENIATQIQQGLGLNEMGVESETTTDALGNPLGNQSSFIIGKRISKRVYVRYSVAISNSVNNLDNVNVFQVRYLLNDNWSLQGNSSTLGNGGDVLYSIAKN